jgi:hypothetical protein
LAKFLDDLEEQDHQRLRRTFEEQSYPAVSPGNDPRIESQTKDKRSELSKNKVPTQSGTDESMQQALDECLNSFASERPF